MYAQQTSSSNLLLSESDRRRFSLTFAPPRGCLQTCIWFSFQTYGTNSCLTESDRHELFRTFAKWLFAFHPGSPSAPGAYCEKRSCVHVARWCRSEVRSWIRPAMEPIWNQPEPSLEPSTLGDPSCAKCRVLPTRPAMEPNRNQAEPSLEPSTLDGPSYAKCEVSKKCREWNQVGTKLNQAWNQAFLRHLPHKMQGLLRHPVSYYNTK